MNARIEHDAIGPAPRLPDNANEYDRRFHGREMRRYTAQKAALALTDAARAHLRWLAHDQAGGCTQLELRRSGTTVRGFHADADSLVAAVLAHPEHTANVGVNPRPAAWAGSGFRECNADSIESITAVRIDVDCCRPMALATEALIRGEVEADARRRAEQGKPALDLAPVTVAIAARCAAGTPGLLAGVEEHKATLRRAIDAACKAESIQPRPDLLDRLVTYANRAAANQPTNDAEHEQAIGAGKRLAHWAREQGFGEPLIVDSGNGAHVWFPVDALRLDPKNREAIALGCAELERLCRIEIETDGSPLRVDPWGGFAATTRLAGCPNRKGADTPERPHRVSRIVQGENRRSGAALALWLASEGAALLRLRQEERARAEADRRARLAARPELDGSGLRNLDRRVEAAVERFIDRHPLSNVGHDETLRNLLRLARMLVWELDLPDGERRFRELVAARCDADHWTARQFEAEIEKALAKAADPAGAPCARGALLAQWVEADAGQTAAWRGERQHRNVSGPPGATEGNAAVDANEQRDGGSSANDAPGTVIEGPWAGSGGAHVFNDDEGRLVKREYDPAADVPFAMAPASKEWLPPLLPDPPTQKRDIANHGVAEFVREYLEHHLGGRVLFDLDAVWFYVDGCWREVPKKVLVSMVSIFHQRAWTRAGNEKREWHATGGNIRDVIGLLGSAMTRDQHFEDSAPGGILSRSPCLAVFGSQAIYMHEGKPCVSKAGPGLRARFAYDFEYSEGLEPAHLLRAMRLDWFRDVEENERELRIKCLREFAGHCLLGSLPKLGAHKMLICAGSGNDGKSELMNIVRRCMPPGSTSSINIQGLVTGACNGEFNRCELDGKLANLVADMSADTIAENDYFKRAVSFEPIDVRPKGGEVRIITPRAAWWGNMNPSKAGHLPKLEGQSGGMLRRFLLVHFPNSVRAGRETEHLSSRILGLEKREFVCWAVEAALDMLLARRAKFTTPDCDAKLRKLWVSGSLGNDPVSDFVRLACEPAKDDSEWADARSELYPQFTAWIEAMGGGAQERERAKCAFNVFVRRLHAAGVVTTRARRRGTQVQVANIKFLKREDV